MTLTQCHFCNESKDHLDCIIIEGMDKIRCYECRRRLFCNDDNSPKKSETLYFCSKRCVKQNSYWWFDFETHKVIAEKEECIFCGYHYNFPELSFHASHTQQGHHS